MTLPAQLVLIIFKKSSSNFKKFLNLSSIELNFAKLSRFLFHVLIWLKEVSKFGPNRNELCKKKKKEKFPNLSPIKLNLQN